MTPCVCVCENSSIFVRFYTYLFARVQKYKKMKLNHNIQSILLILIMLLLGVGKGVADNCTISTNTGWVKNSNGATSGQTYYKWWYSNNTAPLITIESSAGNAIAVSGSNLSVFPGASGNNVSIKVGEGYTITGVSFDYQSNGSTMSYNSTSIVTANSSGSWSKLDFNTNQVIFSFAGTNNGTVLSNFIITVVADKQYFKDKITYFNHNFSQLYTDDAKVTAITAVDAASTLADVQTAMDAFYRTAEDKVMMFSNGSNNSKRYYIQQTTNTSINLTETSTTDSRFTLKYAGEGAYYVKSSNNDWYWGYLNSRNGAFGGTGDTQWAGKWILYKAASPNSTGDNVTLYCTNSTTGYYYLHAANGPRLTDWNDTDASKWTMDVIEETPWTVNITGGIAADRVIFADAEYADGSQITADAISPTDVKTNINDRFVWGPIIDAENHTVTFEVRSTQTESIIGGKFYQLQMYNREGTYFAPNGTGNLIDAVNSMNPRFKGSNIYLTGGNKASGGWTVELTGIPDNPIVTYLYVPNATSTSAQLQMQNGNYIDWQSQSQSAVSNINVEYIPGHNSFWWKNPVYPWGNLNGINASVGKSGSTNGPIELLFHPVTTGEDYDIYKVITAGEVECTNANLVTKIINAGGTFFFLQKGTAITAADFLINGSEPTTITTNTVHGYIELSLTERPHTIHEITSLASITDMYGYYKLTADVNAPTQIATDFHGELDGNYHKITGVTSALFANLVNGTVKNVILEDVNISGDIVGAIANTAIGNSRVYNCGIIATNAKTVDHDQPFISSSKISGTTAGSIVGKIEGNARVVNCYSYADVNGTNAGGIVGDWAGTWYNGTTGLMVANCMYYGNLTGTNRSPIVYGGSDINGSYSIYSYFRWKSMSTTNFTRQNGALAATEDMWLDRFKFFQAGVTNHRDIAAYYVFGDASRISDIGQWYIDETIAPWPILRKAEKRTTILSKATQVISSSAADKEPNTGAIITDVKNDITKRYDKMPGTNGKLTVNFTINGTNFTKDLPITDMDDKHYDYTWGKVVLPFANEFEGWIPDYDYICTGWEITSVSGGTAGTLTDYNFADRDCTAKDIYNATNNPIIFAQGGNYIVPYGVTAITVNAHFAKAYYLSDPNYDCAAGGANAHGGTRPTTYRGKTVYTTAAAAWGAMQAKTLPHDQALVLVGNYHYTTNSSNNDKGCTVISVDEDCDQQPDYGWYMAMGTVRQSWMPVRWDFVPIIGSGLIQIASDMLPSLSIPRARGWFEISETALCRTYEFEVNDGSMTAEDNRKGNNAYIIKGGWFQQLVRCFDQATNNRMSYFHIGGNAYIKEFFPGNHSSTHLTYNIRPVNVTGGDIESCFMTGQNPGSTIIGIDNNVRFYCSGGNIGKYLSVYMEQPVVNATMKVDHARIGRFFGGGTTPNAQLSGNIDITMNYSNVDFFCGGPEFGDMTAEKTVTVNTTGSTFGEFYGAGFGGTALTRHRYREVIDNNASMSSIDNYSSIRLQYDTAKGGVGVSYEMESLLNGSGVKLFRFYDNYAALSMAQTGSVTTNATNCLFKENFFGGGCQGKVDGSITSVLNNCYVTGSVYGGGYKASATEINVYPTTGGTYPEFNTTYKAFSTYGTYPTPEVYTWVSGTDGTVDTSAQTIATSVDMTQMGTVTGNTSLTIKGPDSVVTGDVFGGGAESKVLGNSTVVIGEQP